MKIIHTSDWHLGGRLHDQDRHAEHDAFAVWLKALLRREKADALVVAGDVFDTCAPSNRAQGAYFSLLAEIYAEKLCRVVVVVGGNHDSPSLLDAPAAALIHLNARVVGEIDAEDPARQVVLVPDADGVAGLAIAAVPYLREGDLRTAEAGETDGDRTAKLHEGFQAHYGRIADRARRQAREQSGREVPLLLTGHLYLTGARRSDDRSERALRVGNLGELPTHLLPLADYVALGHLHRPQAVPAGTPCRYSGSPLPLSFGEAGEEKSVAIVTFGRSAGDPINVRLETVPAFQRLEQVRGAPENIAARLRCLAAAGESVWVEVQVTEGEGDLGPFWNSLPQLVDGSPVRILAHQNCRAEARAALTRNADSVGLEQLTPTDIFSMRLADDPDLSDAERQWLPTLFAEILKTVQEEDLHRE